MLDIFIGVYYNSIGQVVSVSHGSRGGVVLVMKYKMLSMIAALVVFTQAVLVQARQADTTKYKIVALKMMEVVERNKIHFVMDLLPDQPVIDTVDLSIRNASSVLSDIDIFCLDALDIGATFDLLNKKFGDEVKEGFTGYGARFMYRGLGIQAALDDALRTLRALGQEDRAKLLAEISREFEKFREDTLCYIGGMEW